MSQPLTTPLRLICLFCISYYISAFSLSLLLLGSKHLFAITMFPKVNSDLTNVIFLTFISWTLSFTIPAIILTAFLILLVVVFSLFKIAVTTMFSLCLVPYLNSLFFSIILLLSFLLTFWSPVFFEPFL